MNARRRTAALAVAALSATAALTACDVDVDTGSGTSHTREATYDIAQPVKNLTLKTDAGSVRVTEQDVQAVKVVEKKKYDDNEPSTSRNVNGDTLTLGYDCRGGQTCYVSYEITVPKGTAVDVDTDAGKINLAGLSGKVKASTDAGTINGENITAKDLEARADAGNIDISFTAAPTRINAETNAGGATVRLPASGTYAVDVSSSIGKTEMKVPSNPSSANKVRVHTDAGSAKVLAS